MAEAVAESHIAASVGDVPVGAVVVHEGAIIARGHNRREANQDPTWHAEIEALRGAARALGRWRLTGCTLVVTLEPCAMCAYACVLARVDRVVYGATDPRYGAAGSFHNILTHPGHNHIPAVVAGVRGPEIAAELKAFFKARR